MEEIRLRILDGTYGTDRTDGTYGTYKTDGTYRTDRTDGIIRFAFQFVSIDRVVINVFIIIKIIAIISGGGF